MRPDEVRLQATAVRALYRDDPEEAHHLEDQLMRDVLRSVRSGVRTELASQLAAEVLELAEETSHERWYA